MADGVTFQSGTPATPAASTVVLTDETASGHAQVIKLASSSNGSATLVDVGGLLTAIQTATEAAQAALEATLTVQGTITANGDVDVTSLPAGSMHFDADGDNTAQAMKAAAGKLYALEVSNSNSVDCWIQLFNTAAGSVTVGTTTPVQSYFVPANGAMDKAWPTGLNFSTAITYACTTTATGSGDPTTGLVVNGVYV